MWQELLSDVLSQVVSFLRVLWFPPTGKLVALLGDQRWVMGWLPWAPPSPLPYRLVIKIFYYIFIVHNIPWSFHYLWESWHSTEGLVYSVSSVLWPINNLLYTYEPYSHFLYQSTLSKYSWLCLSLNAQNKDNWKRHQLSISCAFLSVVF